MMILLELGFDEAPNLFWPQWLAGCWLSHYWVLFLGLPPLVGVGNEEEKKSKVKTQ